MSWLNPIGLWAFAALPLLVLPYLIRERPKRRLVPALFLYEGIEQGSRLLLMARMRTLDQRDGARQSAALARA